MGAGFAVVSADPESELRERFPKEFPLRIVAGSESTAETPLPKRMKKAHLTALGVVTFFVTEAGTEY
jgi:hypothetical protein